ncbi:MAG: DUF896 domain-containing protein [Ruminococcus sp.]|nr:DUF896 domain-containing protein [Ruminococcus sp.]MBQ8905759.1 DUF896 domain-containing protein [Ruminococcus sp.]
MTQEQLDRISELYRKSQAEGLTEEERAEQKALRDEYRAGFVRNLTGQLDNTYVVYPDGTKKKVGEK